MSNKPRMKAYQWLEMMTGTGALKYRMQYKLPTTWKRVGMVEDVRLGDSVFFIESTAQSKAAMMLGGFPKHVVTGRLLISREDWIGNNYIAEVAKHEHGNNYNNMSHVLCRDTEEEIIHDIMVHL